MWLFFLCLALLFFPALLQYDARLWGQNNQWREEEEEVRRNKRELCIHSTKQRASNDLFTLLHVCRLVGWASVVQHTGAHWHTSASCPISAWADSSKRIFVLSSFSLLLWWTSPCTHSWGLTLWTSLLAWTKTNSHGRVNQRGREEGGGVFLGRGSARTTHLCVTCSRPERSWLLHAQEVYWQLLSLKPKLFQFLELNLSLKS